MGWAIWQCGRYFIEGELHAVHVQDGEGAMVDVTPRVNGERKIRFLADNTVTYEYGTLKQ